MRRKTENVLLELGITPNLKGFDYICEAVEILSTPKESVKIVNGIYADIAKEFNTTNTRVERAIRHAISKMDKDSEAWEKYMGIKNTTNYRRIKSMDNRIANDKVTISGEIVSEFAFSHEFYGEKFYTAELSSERTSGKRDTVPIMVSDRIVDVSKEWTGQTVRVSGQLRTYNKHEENRTRLLLSVFVREFEAWEYDGMEIPPNDENTTFLDGFICKEPNYRETPLGREITDIILAVNRPYGKSDYIPCIVWGRNARFVSSLEVGTHIQIWGRLQSREYQKKIGEDEVETRVAYEVSVSRIEVVEETESTNADL